MTFSGGLLTSTSLSYLGVIFFNIQVVDVGALRMISNHVSMYAEWVSKEEGSLVHGDFSTSVRSSKKRYSHACMVERVPYLEPGCVRASCFSVRALKRGGATAPAICAKRRCCIHAGCDRALLDLQCSSFPWLRSLPDPNFLLTSLCRYWNNPGTRQPRLKGNEQRLAVNFIPFSVSGIFGTSQGDWCHTALTWSLCEFAALIRDIFGPARAPKRTAADSV